MQSRIFSFSKKEKKINFLSVNYLFYFRENESVTLSQNIEVRPVIAPQVSAHSTANNTISVEVGNNFTLSCGYKIRGDPKPSIIWTKDGKTLQNTITVPDTAGDYFQYQTVLTNR